MTTARIRPIRTEQDYDDALKMIEEVFDAPEGSEEADRRDVLAVLIERYEDEHYPIDLPDPIEAIKARMDDLDLSQRDLVPYIGSASKVSEVLSRKRPLSIRMIRALHAGLGIPTDVLLQECGAQLPDLPEGMDPAKFPVNELARYGVFESLGFSRPADHVEECIQYLITAAGGYDTVPAGMFRHGRSERLRDNQNTTALNAWLLWILSQARLTATRQRFVPADVNGEFLATLTHMSVLNDGPRVAVELLAQYGIVVITAPHFKQTYLDGASLLDQEGNAVIGLTLRYDRLDNFWFTLLHEIGHLVLHLTEGGYIADDMTLRDQLNDSDIEREADRFTERALLPHDFDQQEWDRWSGEQIRRYAIEHSIHPAIVAGHIRYQQKNYRRFSKLVGHRQVKMWFERGAV